jgi:hypothetical protein
MRGDVQTRALAHTLTCPTCRQALDAEVALRRDLVVAAAPEPSPSLLAGLLALGGPGGPMPMRHPVGPGMPRPMTVPVDGGRPGVPPMLAPRPGALAMTPPTPPGRPAAATHPGVRRRPSTRRALVVAAAGALGAGVVAAGVLTSAAVPAGQTPLSELVTQQGGAAGRSGVQRAPGSFQPAQGQRFAPVVSGTWTPALAPPRSSAGASGWATVSEAGLGR